MEDLPKPVWDLLAQKIDDAKTWFSFVQVSRLTRFLGEKYKKEKQNQFSILRRVEMVSDNVSAIYYSSNYMPNGSRLPHHEDIGIYTTRIERSIYNFYNKDSSNYEYIDIEYNGSFDIKVPKFKKHRELIKFIKGLDISDVIVRYTQDCMNQSFSFKLAKNNNVYIFEVTQYVDRKLTHVKMSF